MNTTETIILTTIINVIITGLVGGIIIYAIQKKIDAATQKSLFEHQVKFSRAYPKTLEVLDALYQKFMTFTDAVKGWVDHVEAFFIMEGSTGAGEFRGYYSDVQEKFEECEKYFAANRLYLSDSLILEIQKVFREAELSYEWIAKNLDPDALSSVEYWIDVKKSTDRNIAILGSEAMMLENLYKSAADNANSPS